MFRVNPEKTIFQMEIKIVQDFFQLWFRNEAALTFFFPGEPEWSFIL